MNESTLREIVNRCYSIAGVLKECGLAPATYNYKKVQRWFKEYNISIEHFDGKGWNKGDRYRDFTQKINIKYILVEDSNYGSIQTLKNRLFSEGFKKKECEKCKLSEWLSEPIPLELHHINGVSNDHRIDNLQILCPNCHAQTDNFCGKNIRGRKEKPLKRDKKLSPTIKEQDYYISIRKVSNRPSKETLLTLLNDNSYRSVGRMYGVSDNCIRKWLKTS